MPQKTGWYDIGGFSPPFWLRSGFHALPPCRPALSGCTVFCADFFYRVFFTIPVTFMFVWTIKPLFFFAAHLHPISFKVSLCVIVSPLIHTQLPITSNTRPDKPERTFNTFPGHYRNYIVHVHQRSGTDLFYQYLPSRHQKLHLPLSSVQPLTGYDLDDILKRLFCMLL